MLVAGLLLLVTGCAQPKMPYPEAFHSERPDERVLAVRHAAEIGDRSVVPLLVDRLEDQDEAVRFYAILALEKLAGTRMGYDYGASAAQRWRAVERWRRHLARSRASSGPADTGRLSGADAASVDAGVSADTPVVSTQAVDHPMGSGGADR